MATQKEIRVGSIVSVHRNTWDRSTGVVVASPSHHSPPPHPPAADIYWFTKKRIVWEYISYLEVLVK